MGGTRWREVEMQVVGERWGGGERRWGVIVVGEVEA